MSSASQRTTQTAPRESTDVGQVLHALSNGLRSDVEIAGTAHLSLDRVQIALIYLLTHKCVVGSPASRFRLTDNGNDMVKAANAAERQLGAYLPVPRIMKRQNRSVEKANGNTSRRREKSSQDGAAAHQRIAAPSRADLARRGPNAGSSRDRDLGFGDGFSLTGRASAPKGVG